ncbi:MAG: glycosyltransferase family 2 protein [Rikenellaceae bacterium]
MTGVVILNYNNYTDTINCIESVEKYNTADIKYVVVDNGSTNELAVSEISKYMLAKFENDCELVNEKESSTSSKLKRATFLISKSNSGYAQGNNKGLKLLELDDEIENILILNNDILFVEDIIPRLTEVQSQRDDCAIVSPILYKRDMAGIDYNCARLNHNPWEIILTQLFLYRNICNITNKMRDKRMLLLKSPELLNHDITEIELPSGSCMLMKKELFSKIGWFDPNTFLYYEENILYKKITRMGLKNYLLLNCKCIHLGAASTSKASNSFTLNAEKDSVTYYLGTYDCLSPIQKLMLSFSRVLVCIKVKLIKQFKS